MVEEDISTPPEVVKAVNAKIVDEKTVHFTNTNPGGEVSTPSHIFAIATDNSSRKFKNNPSIQKTSSSYISSS
jgi:hypothetical protein